MRESYIVPTSIEQGAAGHLLAMGDLDARHRDVQRVRRKARALAKDLGDDLSNAQSMMVWRAAMLSILAEHCEASMLSGVKVATADYMQVIKTLRLLLTTLSPDLKRHAKDVTPSSWGELIKLDAAQSEREAEGGAP